MAYDTPFSIEPFERLARREAQARAKRQARALERGLATPSIAPFEYRVYRGRLGGIARARKQLLKQAESAERTRRLAELEQRENLARDVLEVVGPPRKAKQRMWEFTAYYEYLGGKKSNEREFEVKFQVPFPASFTASDVAKYNKVAEMMAEIAMGKAFNQQQTYDKMTWSHFLVNYLKFRSDGWEPMETSETELKGGDETEVEGGVIDKIAHYWKGKIDVKLKWEYPE